MRNVLLRTRLPRYIHGFVRSETATVTVEAVIVLPLVIWVYIAGVVFFDAFRTQNTNAKATYVVADLLSRQVDPVNAAMLDGLNDVYSRLARSRHPTAIRVSTLDWDMDQDDYRIRWSYGTSDWADLTPSELETIRGSVPNIASGESLIMVETEMDYVPMQNIGIAAQTLDHRAFVRPRFAPNLTFEQ